MLFVKQSIQISCLFNYLLCVCVLVRIYLLVYHKMSLLTSSSSSSQQAIMITSMMMMMIMDRLMRQIWDVMKMPIVTLVIVTLVIISLLLNLTVTTTMLLYKLMTSHASRRQHRPVAAIISQLFLIQAVAASISAEVQRYQNKLWVLPVIAAAHWWYWLTRKVWLPISVLYWLWSRCGWLGSLAVSVLDSGAEVPGFKSQLRHCRVTVLCKLLTPIVPLFTKQQNW